MYVPKSGRKSRHHPWRNLAHDHVLIQPIHTIALNMSNINYIIKYYLGLVNRLPLPQQDSLTSAGHLIKALLQVSGE
ncbi:hypothetical protein EYC80_007561 [Monilinia laxa]|uniref:Uncharacterized protein n=1 Tax=Monilinia laxa TaxID=61186 RepID=A0A5N6JWA8_MONLA|nr:hypothetical protein EYC80_007561 [Monilinia laxa]